jgi:hypothetical protein
MDRWEVEERLFVVVRLVMLSFVYCSLGYVNRVVKKVCSRHTLNSVEENSRAEGKDTPSSQKQVSLTSTARVQQLMEAEDCCYDLFRCEIDVVYI